jgi:hypothetical protein
MSLIPVSGAFSAVGLSPLGYNRSRGDVPFAIAGTFVGSVVLEVARNNLSSWHTVAGPFTGPASGLLSSGEDGVHRFRCTSYTSGSIGYSFTPTGIKGVSLGDLPHSEVGLAPGSLFDGGSYVGVAGSWQPFPSGGGFTPGTPIDGSVIGGVTPAAATFTTLASTGAVNSAVGQFLFNGHTGFAIYGTPGANTTVAIGSNAGSAQSTSGGGFNTFVGDSAGQFTAPGAGENTFVGNLAGVYNVNGHQSVYVGCGAGWNELSSFNVAIGSDCYRNVVSSQTSSNNVAIGLSSQRNGSGYTNTSVGSNALQGTATTIVFSGTQTATDVVTCTFTIGAAGIANGYTGFTQAYSVTVTGGMTSAQLATAMAAQINTTLPTLVTSNGVRGTQAGASGNSVLMTFPGTSSTGACMTVTGSVTGAATEIVTVISGFTGFGNTALGFNAMINNFATTASNNIGIGYNCLGALTTASSVIAIGTQAGQSLTTGGGGVVIGSMAATNATTQPNLVAIGNNALAAITIGPGYDIAIGGNACANFVGQNTGNQSVVVGGLAFNGAAATFSGSVGVGYQVGNHVTSGSLLTLIGCNTGRFLTTGGTSTFIGNGVGPTAVTGINNILIGSGAATGGPTQVDVAAAATSHVINIGNVFTATGTNVVATSAAAVAGNFAFGGHLSNSRSTAAPTINAGGTLDASASDAAATVTGGTASTGFVVTFGTAYTTAPHVVMSSPSGAAITSYAVTTTTLTVVTPSATGATFTYQCIQ